MRISTSQVFSSSLQQLNSSLNEVAELNMMTSSQKKLNRPSDDPTGMGTVVELNAYDQSLSDYIDNCDTSGDYLSLADEALNQVSENITAALELTEQASTETYTTSELQMMALEMESYLDSILNISNTQMGSDSLFAGDDLGGSAYEKGLGVTVLEDSIDSANITDITGEIDSSVYVRFDSDGTVGTDELDYSYSTDNGETWTSATLAAGDTQLDLDTCQLEITAGTVVTGTTDDASGTEFVVREAVMYTGSDEAMTVAISESTSIDMTSVGCSIFGGVDPSTGTAYEEPNLFETISDCIVYMELGDYDSVAECLDTLSDAHENVETGAANLGARENKVTYTESALSLAREITATSISREEDADAAQLIVELEQANYVYEAVLSSSSSIMNMSLLDYI
jgi:flagellar hook-associated protein 3 FlgL